MQVLKYIAAISIFLLPFVIFVFYQWRLKPTPEKERAGEASVSS